MKISCNLLALSIIQPLVLVTHGFVANTRSHVTFASRPLYSTAPQINANAPGTVVPGGRPVFPTTTGSPDISQSWKVQPTAGPVKDMLSKDVLWEKANAVVIQGSSLRTCSFDESVARVQVLLRSEGRPLNSNVELWQGPDNCPQKVNVYLEDGGMRQFRAIIETPRASNAVCIRNTAPMEFPLTACVDSDVEDANGNLANPREMLAQCKSKIVQGGAVNTTPFPPAVSSVMVLLQTDGRPLNARIELLQGPNNNKQVMEVYIEDGSDRPFFAIVDTPGSGNVVRIVNTSTVEFPMNAIVEAYETTLQEDISHGGQGMVWSE